MAADGGRNASGSMWFDATMKKIYLSHRPGDKNGFDRWLEIRKNERYSNIKINCPLAGDLVCCNREQPEHSTRENSRSKLKVIEYDNIL
mmetsp:Transcript_3264/g.6264  ORF Transcript_3264/g.6264 Transcript_3264/m.6264 type:complete len:89 (-) Transcript_3264:8-274(-)